MSEFARYMAQHLAQIAQEAGGSYEDYAAAMKASEGRWRERQDSEEDLFLHHLAGRFAELGDADAAVLHQGLRRLTERARKERGDPPPIWPDVSIYVEEVAHV